MTCTQKNSTMLNENPNANPSAAPNRADWPPQHAVNPATTSGANHHRPVGGNVNANITPSTTASSSRRQR
jgi:hypothetical protein